MTRYAMNAASTRACDGISRRIVPTSLAGTAKEAAMKTLSLIAALMIAAPAHAADMPINKEPHINHVLLQGFIGDAIADNCPTMEPRKLRALGELNKLRAYAQDKG